jgi:hypothetical protein
MWLGKQTTAVALPVPLRAIICLQRSFTQKKVPVKVWPFTETFCTGIPEFSMYFQFHFSSL